MNNVNGGLRMVMAHKGCVICNPEYDEFGVDVSTRIEDVAGPNSLKTVKSIAFPADEEVQFPDDNETGGKVEDSIFHNMLWY